MLFTFNCDKKYYDNKKLLEIAKSIDFSELQHLPEFKTSEHDDTFTMNVDDNEIRLLQTLINEDIVGRGMDNQNTVNEIGKMLYWLYDEILYQKKHQ